MNAKIEKIIFEIIVTLAYLWSMFWAFDMMSITSISGNTTMETFFQYMGAAFLGLFTMIYMLILLIYYKK